MAFVHCTNDAHNDCVETGTQWTLAAQADCMLLPMDAIRMALLENSKQSSIWLGQRYVLNFNIIYIFTVIY